MKFFKRFFKLLICSFSHFSCYEIERLQYVDLQDLHAIWHVNVMTDFLSENWIFSCK